MIMSVKYLFIAMRPYQLLKNVFILMPLVFGRQLFNFLALSKTIFMFLLFSLISSAIYLINDVVDLQEDRQHPIKRLRPLASGKITVFQAKIAAMVISGIVIPLSFILDIYAGWIILAYTALNCVYMRVLKKVVIIDAFCIAAFFYLRILGGAVTSGAELSNWIILCTVLIALFLAFNKRRYDLRFSRGHLLTHAKYSKYFIDQMISIISSSIVMAYALYVMDTKTQERFGTGHLIYTVPFVYYGIFRYLYLVDKKGLGGDSAFILLKDHKTQLNLILWIMICIAIIYFKL